jgi:hypothetical protein
MRVIVLIRTDPDPYEVAVIKIPDAWTQDDINRYVNNRSDWARVCVTTVEEVSTT